MQPHFPAFGIEASPAELDSELFAIADNPADALDSIWERAYAIAGTDLRRLAQIQLEHLRALRNRAAHADLDDDELGDIVDAVRDKMHDLREDLRALEQHYARPAGGDGISIEDFIPAVFRTFNAPRARGAGRPRGQRRVTRSSAKSGDSGSGLDGPGDPDPDEHRRPGAGE